MTKEEIEMFGERTVGDLFDFLVLAGKTGEISQSLSAHLRAAVKKIFIATCPPTELWRNVLLRTIDLDARVSTLREKASADCSEQTIRAYHQRYERSLRLYLEHIQAELDLSSASSSSSTTNSFDGRASATNNSGAPSNYQDLQAQLVVMQKVMQAAVTFQQEITAAFALLNTPKGGPPSMS